MFIVRMARFIERHRLAAHLLVPAAVSLALIGLYYSGVAWMQAIVAPTIEGLDPFSRREFGALEWLQNAVVLLIVAATAACSRAAPARWLQAALAGACALFVFVLLEEVDYGAHLAALLTDSAPPLSREGWTRNLHNLYTADGVQYGSYMRLAATVSAVIGFVLAPLALHRSVRPGVRLLLPSPWMVVTVALMAALSSVAHRLDDAGFAVIDGVQGNLAKNVSEFRELTLYYLFALYFVELRGRLEARGGSAGGR